MKQRLIDANYMKEHMVGNDEKGLREVIENWIDKQPTVEAITIEWLKQKALESKDLFNRYLLVMWEWFTDCK